MSAPVVTGPPGLHAEVRALDGQFPGWHAWLGSTGVVHATTCRCPGGCGSGTTLEAPNPQRMAQVIAEQVHEWDAWPAQADVHPFGDEAA